MKFSIILAVAALSAETFACANVGQACKKGDPDVCQCGAPLTVKRYYCYGSIDKGSPPADLQCNSDTAKIIETASL
ncbi:hypothetical protein F25303_5933 [Fusarium sp. NRRL 25303]|nr:hypothetical protein F25303_5933 [Fusarium sp. NRRL 25303]